jgi:hypothetical protein
MAILVENKNMGGGHWYQPDGTPLHQVPKADGKGMRDTTLADAKSSDSCPLSPASPTSSPSRP